MRKGIHGLVLFAFASLGLTGCVKQTILAFEDHGKFPVTSMEVFVKKDYYVYRTYEHRFYMCNDAGNQLLCKRSCGGSTDIACPSALSTAYGGGTNVR